MTNSTEFHRGLLCALALRRRSFSASGDAYHRAYRAALDADPRPTEETKRALEEHDPVFGTYQWAEDMLLIGMRDLIVELDGSTFSRAHICISGRAAVEMLSRDVGDADRFKQMAEAMDRAFDLPIGHGLTDTEL